MSIFAGFEKVERILGAERAQALLNEVKTATGLDSFEDPDGLLAFGNALVDRGGIMEAIGRSLKIQALLRGAQGQPEG